MAKDDKDTKPDPADAVADAADDVTEEFETIGDLVDAVVSKTVEATSKAWAKTFADLLDMGAQSSDGDTGGGDGGEPPAVDTGTDGTTSTPVRARRFKLL